MPWSYRKKGVLDAKVMCILCVWVGTIIKESILYIYCYAFVHISNEAVPNLWRLLIPKKWKEGVILYGLICNLDLQCT